MHSHRSNSRPTSRALSASSMTLLTLVTLVACLSASQSNTQQRDTRAARITATVFGPRACLVVFANLHVNTSLPAPTAAHSIILVAATQSFHCDSPLYPPLRAMPPPMG